MLVNFAKSETILLDSPMLLLMKMGGGQGTVKKEVYTVEPILYCFVLFK